MLATLFQPKPASIGHSGCWIILKWKNLGQTQANPHDMRDWLYLSGMGVRTNRGSIPPRCCGGGSTTTYHDSNRVPQIKLFLCLQLFLSRTSITKFCWTQFPQDRGRHPQEDSFMERMVSVGNSEQRLRKTVRYNRSNYAKISRRQRGPGLRCDQTLGSVPRAWTLFHLGGTCMSCDKLVAMFVIP